MQRTPLAAALAAAVAAACVLSAAIHVPVVTALPAGMATWFASETCPPGWFADPVARGRLIVSTDDATLGGVTVGEPLAPEEDRSHTHNYTATVSLQEKHVAAIGCCNDQGASHGDYPVSSETGPSSSGLPMVQLALCQLKADTQGPVPFGSVAFFDSTITQCPTGWKSYSGAAGRVIVPGYAASGTLPSQSNPLKSGEDRPHGHGIALNVTTPAVSYAGVDGCCNDGPAAAGVIDVPGSADSISSGIPYLQMLTCVSQIATFNSTGVPDGAFLFNQVSCAPGWNASIEAAGRFPVSLPAGGVPGATFGGASMAPGYTGYPATHAHTVEGSVSTGTAGVGLASGCCAGGYAGAGEYTFNGESSTTVTDVPYLSMPLCARVGTGKALTGADK